MNMIQSAMLVLLGFSVCGLITLLLAPAYWSRAVRLTRTRMQDTLPVTEAEFRADKDRMRAQYAVRVHQLQSQIEQAKLNAARQLIELNRRDARISALESQSATLEANLEEQQNARRVLEQTVADRVPRIERRLVEARQLIQSRDRDIDALSAAAQKQKQAFDEAHAINNQRRAEVDRLNRTLMAHRTRSRDSVRDGSYETELALRSEIAALKSQTEQQTAMLDSLRKRAAGKNELEDGAETGAIDQADMDELRRDLQEAERQLKDARQSSESSQETASAKISELTDQLDEKSAEISRLKASLAAYEEDEPTSGRLSIKESRIALKARLGSMQVNAEQQERAIKKLRADLLAANERAARQNTYFVNEMRRLGAGTLPTSPPSSLPSETTSRRSGSTRIGEPRSTSPLSRSENGRGRFTAGSEETSVTPSEAIPTETNGSAPVPEADEHKSGSPLADGAGEQAKSETPDKSASAAPEKPEAGEKAPVAKRTRLLDRISSISRS